MARRLVALYVSADRSTSSPRFAFDSDLELLLRSLLPHLLTNETRIATVDLFAIRTRFYQTVNTRTPLSSLLLGTFTIVAAIFVGPAGAIDTMTKYSTAAIYATRIGSGARVVFIAAIRNRLVNTSINRRRSTF